MILPQLLIRCRQPLFGCGADSVFGIVTRLDMVRSGSLSDVSSDCSSAQCGVEDFIKSFVLPYLMSYTYAIKVGIESDNACTVGDASHL